MKFQREWIKGQAIAKQADWQASQDVWAIITQIGYLKKPELLDWDWTISHPLRAEVLSGYSFFI